MTLDLIVAESGDGLCGGGYDSIGTFTLTGILAADTIQFKSQHIEKHALQYTGTSTDGVDFAGAYLNLGDHSTGGFELQAPTECVDT